MIPLATSATTSSARSRLQKYGSGGGDGIGTACFVLAATGGQCLHARDGFRQGGPIEACESEVNVGGVFRALSLHFCETPLHVSASDGLGLFFPLKSPACWTLSNEGQGYTRTSPRRGSERSYTSEWTNQAPQHPARLPTLSADTSDLDSN
jgi:hypothetical protein